MIQRETNVGRRTRHYTTINSVRASDITRRSEDEGKTRIQRGTNVGRMTRHSTTVNLVRTIHIATRSNDEDNDVTWTTRHYITINLRRRRGRRAMVAPAAGRRGEVSNCGFGGEARRIRGGGRDII